MYEELFCAGLSVTICLLTVGTAIAWLAVMAAAIQESQAAQEHPGKKERLLKSQARYNPCMPSDPLRGCSRPASMRRVGLCCVFWIVQTPLGSLTSHCHAALCMDTSRRHIWCVLAISRTRTGHRRQRLAALCKCSGCVLQVCDLETTLTIERARAEEAEKVAARAERRLRQAFMEAR